MNDDIGILPMPKYDEAQENYKSAAWGGAVWTLSRTFDMADAEKLGSALEAMSFYGYRDVIPVYKEVALKTKTTRDNESADMLDIIFGTIYFDFGTNIMYDAVFAGGIHKIDLQGEVERQHSLIDGKEQESHRQVHNRNLRDGVGNAVIL